MSDTKVGADAQPATREWVRDGEWPDGSPKFIHISAVGGPQPPDTMEWPYDPKPLRESAKAGDTCVDMDTGEAWELKWVRK